MCGTDVANCTTRRRERGREREEGGGREGAEEGGEGVGGRGRGGDGRLDLPPIVLCIRYLMSGTCIALTTGCAVLRSLALCEGRYWLCVCYGRGSLWPCSVRHCHALATREPVPATSLLVLRSCTVCDARYCPVCDARY
eukprot:3126617-Rhodomonas_salina.1